MLPESFQGLLHLQFNTMIFLFFSFYTWRHYHKVLLREMAVSMMESKRDTLTFTAAFTNKGLNSD